MRCALEQNGKRSRTVFVAHWNILRFFRAVQNSLRATFRAKSRFRPANYAVFCGFLRFFASRQRFCRRFYAVFSRRRCLFWVLFAVGKKLFAQKSRFSARTGTNPLRKKRNFRAKSAQNPRKITFTKRIPTFRSRKNCAAWSWRVHYIKSRSSKSIL